MAFVNIYNRFCTYRIFWLLYGLLYLCIFFLTITIFRTANDAQIPFEVKTENVIATRRIETIEVRCTKQLNIESAVKGITYRSIQHVESGITYEMGGTFSSFDVGTQTSTKVFIIPGALPNGRYIIKTVLVWRPSFSFREHISKISEVSFTVCDKFEVCHD